MRLSDLIQSESQIDFTNNRFQGENLEMVFADSDEEDEETKDTEYTYNLE